MDDVNIDGSNLDTVSIFLLRAYHRIYSIRRKELKKYGLSLEQVGVLDVVKVCNNYAKPADIARIMFREPQCIFPILEKLKDCGIINITTDEQKKNIRRVSLTPKGEVIYKKTTSTNCTRKIISTLSYEKRQNLQLYLKELITSAAKYAKSKQLS